MQQTMYFDDVLAQIAIELNIPKKQETKPRRPRTRTNSNVYKKIDDRLMKFYKAIDMSG